MTVDDRHQSLWVSPNKGKHPIDDYRRHVNKRFGLELADSHQLQQWSVTRPHNFWVDLYKYVGVIPAIPSHITHAYDDSVKLSDVPRFFEGVKLNYAENVLEGKDPDAIALTGLREFDFLNGENVTWRELRERVRKVRSALIRNGVREGDRVAAIVSTSVWAVVILLAAASVGAIFSSISPDMGEAVCSSPQGEQGSLN